MKVNHEVPPKRAIVTTYSFSLEEVTQILREYCADAGQEVSVGEFSVYRPSLHEDAQFLVLKQVMLED